MRSFVLMCNTGVLQARGCDAQLRRIQAARGVGVRHVQHHRCRYGESTRIEWPESIQRM